MTLLYKSNALAAQSPEPAVRLDYSTDSIIRMVDSCTKKLGKYDIEIDAAQLQQLFFPTPHRQIFISHLSKDKAKAESIKEHIESWCPNYTCFIDSDIWGNMYKIRDYLQDKYAKTAPCNYSHEASNNICHHLTMVLSMALTKAIKDSPYFLYVPHEAGELSLDVNSLTTHSPWVCHELITASLLPEREKIIKAATVFASAPTMELRFLYTADNLNLHHTTLESFISKLRPRIW